jgi:Protein of unknown function (DUF3667)
VNVVRVPDIPAAPVSPMAPCCLNCGTALAGPRPRFCAACGQETRVKAPTLREFAQQFGGAYFATEGALWRTLKLLLFKPGELTRQYLQGRRKHYVLPLRLYLSVSLMVLLLTRLLGDGMVNISADELRADDGKKLSFSILQMGDGTGVGLRDGVFYCDNFPAWLCKRLQRRIDIEPKAVNKEIQQFSERLESNIGGAMFLLLPSFALWLKLVYRSRRLRYTEHLVFALHMHTFWFIAIALAGGLALLLPLLWPNVSGPPAVVAAAVPIYTFLAMRRVYGGRWWPRLLRAGTVALLYLLTLSVALLLVGLWTLVV